MDPHGASSPSRSARPLRAFVLAGVAALALLVPSSSLAQLSIPEIHEEGLPALDTRTASVAPTAEQVAAVEALGATALWNEFGTPQSLIKHGGYLAKGVTGDDAVAAARSFIAANKSLFRLSSVEGLELVADAKLHGSDGHAVTFRQTYDGFDASPDGVVTVGLAGTSADGWDVAYVSSTLTGDEALATSPALSATEAWVDAANAVGEDVSILDVEDRDRRAG